MAALGPEGTSLYSEWSGWYPTNGKFNPYEPLFFTSAWAFIRYGLSVLQSIFKGFCHYTEKSNLSEIFYHFILIPEGIVFIVLECRLNSD